MVGNPARAALILLGNPAWDALILHVTSAWGALILLVIPAQAGIQGAVAKFKMDYLPILRRGPGSSASPLPASAFADQVWDRLRRRIPACVGMTDPQQRRSSTAFFFSLREEIARSAR
ncbi:MAG TPA: hypothetical protein VF292_09425 [Rhodanobacteraceae bacterium]